MEQKIKIYSLMYKHDSMCDTLIGAEVLGEIVELGVMPSG